MLDREGAVAGALPVAELAADPATPVGADLPGRYTTLVVDAACPVVVAVGSAAFPVADGSMAVVVRDGAAVMGVWAGDDLADVLAFGTPRIGIDFTLGPGSTPFVTRSCGYRAAGGDRCGVVIQFAARPLRPGACSNPRGLPVHDFVWSSG